MGWGSRRRGGSRKYESLWPAYVSVVERKAKAAKETERMRKKGKEIQPVVLDGRTIAHSFWGKGWCTHLESFSDYENRLPRGRSYVRNGSVCHLEVRPGVVEAHVSGSSLYTVTIRVKKLSPAAWKAIKAKCSGQIGSMLELLQGKISHQVMTIVADRQTGLFPQPGEIELDCSCPDVAVMCKHVAAALYGVGSRLDARPELLFLLRDVAAEELIFSEVALPAAASHADVLAADRLGDIFGIDLDTQDDAVAAIAAAATVQKPAKKEVPAQVAPGRRAAAPKAATKALTQAAQKAAPKRPSAAKVPTKTARKPGTKPAAQSRTKAGAAQARPAGARAVPEFQPDAKSIATLRALLGLSASDFAGRLGVTAPSVYRWEAAEGTLNLQRRPLRALQQLWVEAHED